MNATTPATRTATITGVAILITTTTQVHPTGRNWTAAPNTTTTTPIAEARPATLADADTFLAFNSYARTAPWDLGANGTLAAPVTPIDNRFGGTAAARLDQAVGTTHDEFEVTAAQEARDGDLISDTELSATYVVAGSSLECDTVKIHMVGEGGTWDSRFTGEFHARGLVQIARRKA